MEDRRSECGAECLLLAQSGHFETEFQCPLLGVKRTWIESALMSAFDPKRTSQLKVGAASEPHFACGKSLM